MAKQRGVYTGRKKALNAATIAHVVARAAAGESKTALARELDISRETLYQYLRQHATTDRIR
ncbi:MAG: Hin recombinase [Chloroflexi bacterium]|nr:Hin recombinase [Chloroflexota bacterium]